MSVTAFTQDELEALEEKSPLPRFFFGVTAAFGIWALATSWPTPHWLWYGLWIPVTTFTLFCWTSCFHETVHQTLFGSQRVSIWFGRFLGAAMFAPYTVYRESHIRHHAYLNKPCDWELWPYSDPNISLRFRRIFVWFDLIFGVFMSPLIYSRIYFHKASPLTSPAVRRAIRNEYFGMIVLWGSVVALVAYFGVWLEFLRAWCLPHFLAGIYQTGRKLTEHLGMAAYDPLLGTRTVIGRGRFTRICTYFNFDIFIHGPHHRHPRIATHQLEKKMEDYIGQNPDVAYPVFDAYWRATLHMLPFMFKNPGVGMNVGAPPPSKDFEPRLENFVVDIAAEVARLDARSAMQTSAVR